MTKFLPIAMLVFLVAGCTELPKNPPSYQGNVATAELNMGPHEALQQIEHVVASPPINLPIEKEEKGSITTGWKQYEGDWHIIRRWQERTRFVITVAPDFDQPNARCKVLVSEETQQRAASQQEFSPSAELSRPERSRELLNEILKQLRK